MLKFLTLSFKHSGQISAFFCLTCCWHLAVAPGPVRERGVWLVRKYWAQFWAMWRSFLGLKLCKVGWKKRIDVASYGRNQSDIRLDDSQFIHCNDRSVSKLKINISISRDYRCDSVFDWHLGTKNGPQMIDLDNQKWLFGQNTSVVIP